MGADTSVIKKKHERNPVTQGQATFMDDFCVCAGGGRWG